MKKGGNPQQIVLNMLEQQTNNNPFAANLLQLAKNNKTLEIEQIARNMAKEKGVDFDKEFNDFKQMLGL
jgi:hypothetical protein